MNLPEGFVLDQAPAQAGGLPPGFVLDPAPPVPQAVQESSADDARTAAAQRLARGVKRANLPGNEITRLGATLDNAIRLGANGMTFGMADRFAGAMDAATGRAPSYEAGTDAQVAQTQALRKAAPAPAAVAEAAGGLLSGVGLIGSGVSLASRVGPGLLARVLGFGAEGGAYGAAHGAGNTYTGKTKDYLDNARKGAEQGAMVGAALPVAGTGASTAYRLGSAFLGPRVEGVGRGASSLLRGAAQADEAGLRGLPQMGPTAMLPDAGPSMLGLAQGAATGTGVGRSRLVGALETRDAGTGDRLARALDDNLGPAPVPSRIEAHLSGSRAQLGQEYEPLLATAQAVNTRQLADGLDTLAVNLRGPEQRAVQQVRQMLDIPGNPGSLDPHPRALLSTRQAIDGLMAGETNPRVVLQLTAARAAVDDELARAVPGIKQVDAQVAELHRQSEGLQRGSQVLDSGKTATRPVELRDEMARGAIPQGEMVGPGAAPARLRQGTRAELDRLVGTNVNDLNVLERKLGTPQDWNAQKLGIVFGEPARDNVARELTANRVFRDTYQKTVQNSQTAQRSGSANAMEGTAGGNVPSDVTLTGLGLKGANLALKVMSGNSSANTKDEIGRILASQGPEAERIARLLLSSATSASSNSQALSRLIAAPHWLGAGAPVYGRK